MSWLRIGDTASMHPVVLRSLELPNATESLKLELFGFVAMAATMCAAHEGDSIIELGTIFQVAGVARGKQLAAAAEYCGYFEQIQNQQTGAIAYKLIEDPELIHMVSKEQREWANQQRNDTRDSKLVVPIRERDGDACRWCGHVVYWNDKRGARGGTYDHLYPGVAAKSPDDMVVSCRGCNSSRKDSQNSDNDLSQLLPAPHNPWVSPDALGIAGGGNYQRREVDGGCTCVFRRFFPRLELHLRCAGARFPSKSPPLAIASRWSAVKARGCVYGRVKSKCSPQRWQGLLLLMASCFNAAACLRYSRSLYFVVTALTCSYEGPAHREKSTNSMSRAVIVITDSMERIQLPQPQSRFTSVPIVLS